MNLETHQRQHRSWYVSLAITFVYLALLIAISWHHEMWRDEVRALSIVRQSGSLFELFGSLKNEGHPPLWYLLLYGLSYISSSSLILPIASIGVALFSALIFLRFSPFPLAMALLWLLGFYPLYEYSVMCRNYGLGMLFVFLFAASFQHRWQAPFRPALALSLLAQTSAVGALYAASAVIALSGEFLWNKAGKTPQQSRTYLVSLLIPAFSIAVAILQMTPERGSQVTGAHSLTFSRVGQALLDSFISHGATFHNAFGSPLPSFVPLVLLLCYFLLRSVPSLALQLFGTMMALELMHRLIYPMTALRHCGFLVLAVVASLWMLQENTALENKQRWLHATPLLLAALLILQGYSGAKAVLRDIRYSLSSAPEVAALLKSKAELHDAIVMAEPDYLAETIPYYHDVDIYLPRQGEFAGVVSFTAARARELSLSTLLTSAIRIANQKQRPVLILLSTLPDSATKVKLMYGLSFKVDSEGFNQLKKSFQKIASFQAATTDERYEAYLHAPIWACADAATGVTNQKQCTYSLAYPSSRLCCGIDVLLRPLIEAGYFQEDVGKRNMHQKAAYCL